MKNSLYILCLILLMSASTMEAKRTLVPRYSSFISIDEIGDTIDELSSHTTLYKDSPNGMFRVAIIHETLTLERIKYIKRMETAAGLSTLAAVLSGVSTFSSDWQQRYRGRLFNYMNSTLADIYNYNAKAARKLDIEAWVENTGNEEMMLADQERGRVWFLQSGQTIRFSLNNPDVMQLRISTLNNSERYFVKIGAGSFMRDAEVSYEDDKIYVFPMYDDDKEFQVISEYVIMDKVTAEQQRISKKDFKAMKKEKDK